MVEEEREGINGRLMFHHCDQVLFCYLVRAWIHTYDDLQQISSHSSSFSSSGKKYEIHPIICLALFDAKFVIITTEMTRITSTTDIAIIGH